MKLGLSPMRMIPYRSLKTIKLKVRIKIGLNVLRHYLKWSSWNKKKHETALPATISDRRVILSKWMQFRWGPRATQSLMKKF